MRKNLSFNEINFDTIENYNTNNTIIVSLENDQIAELTVLFHHIDSIGDRGILALINDGKKLKLKYFPSEIGDKRDYTSLQIENESDLLEYNKNPIVGICFSAYYANGEYIKNKFDVKLDMLKKDDVGHIYTINRKKDADIEIEQYVTLKYKDDNGLAIEICRIEKDEEDDDYYTSYSIKYVTLL